MTRRRMGLAVLVATFAPMGAPPASIAQTAPGVNVRQAWVREAAAGQASTAAYFTIENHGTSPLTLVGVSSPVASTAELHTMQQTPGRSGMGNAPMGGMMRMAQVDRVVVPVHGTVEFKPGGYHVMLFKVTRALATGDEVELTLRFEGGATKTVVAVVGSRTAVTAPGQ